MKKTNIFQVTIIAVLAALFGSGGGIAWGQAYKEAYISGEGRTHFRRGNATNSGTIAEIGVAGSAGASGNVNTEFGAGESSTIQGSNIIAAGKTTLSPGHQFKSPLPNTFVTDIQIGSDYSKNIVLLSYNSKGYASGWVNIACWGAKINNCIQSLTANNIGWMGSTDGGVTPDGSFYANTAVGFQANQYINDNLFGSNDRSITYHASGGFTDPFTGDSWTSGSNLRQWELGIWNRHRNYTDIVAKKIGSNLWRVFRNNGTYTDVPGNPQGYTPPPGSDLFPKRGNRAYFYFTEDKPDHVPYTTLAEVNNATGIKLEAPTVTGGASVTLPDNYTDDGVPLIQVKGDFVQNKAQYDASGTVGSKMSSVANDNTSNVLANDYLFNYRRPTSIAIKGVTTVSNIWIKDLNWWYKRYDAQMIGSADQFLGEWSMAEGCCHVDNMKAWANNLHFVNNYKDDAVSGASKGENLLDAAVLLIDGSDVCVTGNVQDQTTAGVANDKSTDANKSQTNALIVLPVKDHIRLRTKGTFQMNMAHEPDSTTTSAWYYSGEKFRPSQPDIYLYQKASASPAFAFDAANGGLRAFSHETTKWPSMLPPAEAVASVFGVYGNYNHAGKMAEIHTDTTATGSKFNGKVKGVIEVGEKTGGKDHYHVYSGGILKNYESCDLIGNFTMNFGDNFGKTPHFKFTEKDTMFILNYGNNGTNGCDANIHFYEGAPTALNTAFTTALDDGAMQIQALSDVEFRADVNLIDATSKGNSLYMLSDAGNVVTQTFNYKGEHKTDVGRGQFTIWAEDRSGMGGTTFLCPDNSTGNRNSKRGNVYLNHDMKVERQGGKPTETNVIAANNIRTASYTYETSNTTNDTTNIVSRKGDLYLGYAEGISVYDPASTPGNPVTNGNGKNVNTNIFDYKVNDPANKGVLNIKAGYDDALAEMTKTEGMEGGNIYFTQIKTDMAQGGEYPTNITIPYSSEYICGGTIYNKESLHNRKDSYQAYEHSGIIGGVGACGEDHDWGHYGGLLMDARTPTDKFVQKSLIYKGNNADLTVDAGRRGNIIMNTGTELNYQDNTGNAIFRTRNGDIDMRDKTDASQMKGGLLFLAQLENLGDLSKIGVCGCDEERNNVYLQDFRYVAQGASGSVFVGADNNIKLNYGGLTNIGTRQDPFLSKAYEEKDGRVLKVGRGYNPNAADHCGTYFHCDLDSAENRARTLELIFNNASSGGFAAVASDMIDVYKDLIYKGGAGSGMSSVPGTGTLHGESVSGYGLFMKTQGNKKNWTANVFRNIPKCPTDCKPTGCDNLKPGEEATGFLHNTVRMTFHGEAHFHAENQRVHLESPVIESFGAIEFDAFSNGGSNGQITVKTDSLICHDSMIISGGNKVKFSSWSGLPNDQPIIKLGYSRKAAPFEEWAEENKRCRECVSHYKGKVYAKGETPLDTMFVKFGPTTELRRQNVMVIDHTVLSFLTDSFDHVMGGEVLNARYFVDTLKIRNQVEFWTDKMHERDGHLELISEQQMLSKDYAGMYTRHLHLEPIGACGRPGSELWLPGLALDVITYSTFGGFGTQYTDVHVENQANLNPGFTSLRLRGQCFEQRCGTLTMKDLRLDGGSNLNISVGTKKGLNGEYSDAVDVDMLTTYGPVNVNLEIRPCERIEKRCYPIIYYKSVSPNSLNALKLNPSTIKIDGDEYPLHLDISKEGVVYVCVGDAQAPTLSHTVTMPETAGVKTTPGKGIWPVGARRTFSFSASYTGNKPLVVRTNRLIDGKQEVLEGVKMPNGEYEYVITRLQQDVTLTFGPDAVANELLKGTAVWSHGEMIYIRVDRADIASIYSVAGQLVKRVDLPEGDTSIPMSRGAYVITLKDGSVHKVIVK